MDSPHPEAPSRPSAASPPPLSPPPQLPQSGRAAPVPLTYATPRAEPPVKSFFHQAARASWLAPGVAILVGMCLGNSMRGDSSERSARIILAFINLALVVSGFVLGIIALCGIRRYGTRGILVDAIFGLLLSSGLLAMLAWALTLRF